MVLLSNGFVNLAETEVTSGIAAIAVASMPLFAGVFAMLRGRHPSRVEWVGLVIGFLGVIWLNASSALSGSTLGLVCLIIAPVAWAWGSIWSRDQDLPSPFMPIHSPRPLEGGGGALRSMRSSLSRSAELFIAFRGAVASGQV